MPVKSKHYEQTSLHNLIKTLFTLHQHNDISIAKLSYISIRLTTQLTTADHSFVFTPSPA